MRMKPQSRPHEAICCGFWGPSRFDDASTSLACMFLLLASLRMTPAFAGKFLQFGYRLLGPAQVRLQFELSEARHHLPVGDAGILLVPGDLRIRSLDYIEHLALCFRHALDITNQDLRGKLLAKEQLQQQFVARNLRLRRHSQPRGQTVPPLFRDGVNLPGWLALL